MRCGHQYVLLLKLYFLEKNLLKGKEYSIDWLAQKIIHVNVGTDFDSVTKMTTRAFFNEMIRENVLVYSNNCYIDTFGQTVRKYKVDINTLLACIFNQVPSKLLYNIIYDELFLDYIWSGAFYNIRTSIPKVTIT